MKSQEITENLLHFRILDEITEISYYISESHMRSPKSLIVFLNLRLDLSHLHISESQMRSQKSSIVFQNLRLDLRDHINFVVFHNLR